MTVMHTENFLGIELFIQNFNYTNGTTSVKTGNVTNLSIF